MSSTPSNGRRKRRSPGTSIPPTRRSTVAPLRGSRPIRTRARYLIAVANEQRNLRIDRARLMRLARATLAAEGVRSAEISIALVGDDRIHDINRRFLGHDYPTDVISFLLDSATAASGPAGRRAGRPAAEPPRGTGKTLHGEIIISAETAAERAAEYGWRPAEELCLYLVHGLLHLCGYDDLTSAEAEVMRAREVAALRPWKIVPHYVA